MILSGERFYLDLDGYSNTNQLETDLYEMGALVERFFNNQVTKIITNKKEVTSLNICSTDMVGGPFLGGLSLHLNHLIA